MNENRQYLVVVKILSSGNEERTLTPYDDPDVALRKFHDAFNVIGGGPKQIGATLLDFYMNPIRSEVWRETPDTPTEV